MKNTGGPVRSGQIRFLWGNERKGRNVWPEKDVKCQKGKGAPEIKMFGGKREMPRRE